MNTAAVSRAAGAGLTGEEAAVFTAAIDTAEQAGILPGGGIYGTLTMPDPVNGACCIGAAVRGPQYCTCWEPVFNLTQQDPAVGEPDCQPAMCGDCAFRPGSPERSGDPRYSADQGLLDLLVAKGRPFYCHTGVRRAVLLRHPSGAVVTTPPGDYQPPVIDAVPYKADGTPGDLCAGWLAHRARHVRREAGAS